MSIAPGTKLGRYSIRSQLGAGGMGEVYLADDTALNRRVAIKVLAGSAEDAHAIKRMIREAQAAAGLDHPNICTIHEVAEADGHHFIAMQYVEGETLATRLTRGPLALSDMLSLAIHLADALAEAHGRGLLHRDIKPQNVMITPRGQAKLMDFGLAIHAPDVPGGRDDAQTESRLTQPGTVLGTVKYMSPEQVQGQPLDARSDIFSFGVMLYEMASGRHPFAGENPARTTAAILTRTPEPVLRFSPDAPAELDRIITKAIAKEPGDRYQSIKGLLIDLQSLAKHPAGRARPSRLRRYAIPTVAVALAVAGLAYVGFLARPHAAILTDKDTILLADWENTTGDPVLDGTLKTALAVQLEQSPFLNLFSDERVREALGYMGRSPDERVTKAIAREICQREGLKAFLTGSVSALGSHYVIGLEAIDAHSGEILARQQEEAESKEQVLRTLGQAATKLRGTLGESLSSIQTYDVPIEEATTTSLEALQAYSLARTLNLSGRYAEAIKPANRAIELDPRLAVAYATQGTTYLSLGDSNRAAQFLTKAFDLRDHISERERLYVSLVYFSGVTGEIDKALDTAESLTRTYPRFAVGHNNLAVQYFQVGQFNKSVAEYRRALTLHPIAMTYSNLANVLVCVNQFDEAKQTLQQAMAAKLDIPGYHDGLYTIAFVTGDQAAMTRQLEWAQARPAEFLQFGWRADTAAFAGRWRQARAFSLQAMAAAEAAHQKEQAAGYAVGQAVNDAVFGKCEVAREDAAKAVSLARVGDNYGWASVALAECGDSSRSEALAEAWGRPSPNDTLINVLWRPVIRAVTDLHRADAAGAIELLAGADLKQYEANGEFWPQYVRGQAYLALRQGAEAAAEFQTILDHRGWSARSALSPVARLGLARAAAERGDLPAARKGYEAFFALWKDADPDLPILVAAKKEYAGLK